MRQLFTSLAIFIASGIIAQNYCSTTEMQNAWFASHPELKAQFEQLQQQAAETDKALFNNGYPIPAQGKSAAAGTFTIPVVFHILHTGGSENISDAQAQDAISILNDDYNKMNADTNNVVTQFKNNIGNAQINFVLASKDPQGNCTNGIIRHWDANTAWTSGSFSNYIYSWPRHRYLNIYVVKSISSNAAGYTYLPGSGVPQAADAIVILSTYVGSIGSGSQGLSRALTHEVGHWLNLPHVWGGTNQPGVACGDDGVSDTPITKGYSSCSLGNSAICNPGIVENIQNYMEYAYCQRMFTNGQAIRMQNAINSPVAGRNNLSSSANLIFTGVTNPGINCVTLLDISSSAFTVCTGMPATMTSYTSNASPSSYSWSTNNNAIIQNATAANTSMTFTNAGLTTVSCEVNNAGGTTIKTIVVTVIDGVADITSNTIESFEDPSYTLPAFWTVVNETSPNEKWEVFPYVGASGSAAMYVPGELLPPNSIEILEGPAYDFKNNQDAQFTFKYAYAKQNANNKDVFKVQASKNCGGSWTDIYVPSNTQMSQNSGGITSTLYQNPDPSEWKFYNLTAHPNFTPFKNENNVRIRFFFQEDVGGSGYGNRLYLDDVNFISMVGVNELTRAIELNVYPNPSNGEFNLNFTLSDETKMSYQVVNVAGATILEKDLQTMYTGAHSLAINEGNKLAPGIYFLNLQLNGTTVSKKLIIN